MKIAIVFVAIIACALAGPVPAALLKEVDTRADHENTYVVEYHLDDGTVVKERGTRVPGPEGDVWHRSGSYRFISPEHMTYEVTYTADENGYQAHGDHLPKEETPVLH